MVMVLNGDGVEYDLEFSKVKDTIKGLYEAYASSHSSLSNPNLKTNVVKEACDDFMMELEVEVVSQSEDKIKVNTSSSNTTASSQANDDPVYLKLWEKKQRHKNWKFDDEAKVKFNEFRELHKKEIEEKGVDNLTLEEAYEKVLGHCSGYARGLGKGHPVFSKDGKIGRAELEQLQNENNMMRAELEASKKKQADLEQKLRLVMKKIGLDA